MPNDAVRCVLAAVLVMGLSATGLAAANQKGAEQAPTVILDTSGFWRVYHVYAPPVAETDAGFTSVLAKDQPWFHKRSAEPPADWREVGFDDSRWLRGPARIAAETSLIARVCLRGKFTVTDPAKVDELRLTLGYFGGAVVTLNGIELKRGHLAPGDEGRSGLAEVYPESLNYPGSTASWDWTVKIRYQWEKKRVRLFSDVTVPRTLLRKGVNVLAIEVIRPAEPKSSLLENNRANRRRHTLFSTNWSKCSVRWVRLSAATSEGIVQNAVRPKGLQVWNTNLLASDFDADFGDTTEPTKPVRIFGCRNGSFSAKVVVGCDAALSGLRASVGPLTGPGTIHPTSVRIRYGVPWGSDVGAMWRYVYPADFLGALAESCP